MQKRKALFFLLIISLVNGIIYFYRDYFQYQPFASYEKLYKPCDEACEKKWGQYIAPYSNQELLGAGSLVATLDNSFSQLSKIKNISAHLYKKFHDRIGTPNYTIKVSPPFVVYSLLSANQRLELDCGQFAQMFSYFCWSQHIICRNIEIMRPGDHHMVNECYVPELGQWILVDITSGFFLVKSNNEYLNVQTFLKALNSNKPIEAYSLGKDANSIVDLKKGFPNVNYYYKSEYPFYYYYVTNTVSVYKGFEKLKRYILPISWFEIYDQDKKENFLFYLKDILLIIWIILLLLTLIQFLRAND